MLFIRTCQECGYKLMLGDDPHPEKMNEVQFTKYSEMPCPKCKSEAFDYGSPKYNDNKEDNELSSIRTIQPTQPIKQLLGIPPTL